MTSSPPRLVCFDLGGVIIRICRSWAEGCAAAGVPVRLDRDEASLHAAGHDLHVAHQTGRIDLETYAQALSARLDHAFSPQEIRAVHHAWLLGAYAGIPALIDTIHAAGLDTAILSNTDGEHWARLHEFEAVGLVRHRLASHELGLRKPDPAIFRTAETHLQVEGPDILFFDDLPENVQSAADAGWQAHRIDPDRETAPQMERVLRVHGISGALGCDGGTEARRHEGTKGLHP